MATAKPPPLPPRTRPQNARAGHRRWRNAVLLVLIVLAVVVAVFSDEIMGRAKAGAAYGARMACSCRYLGGRNLEDCRKDFVPGMSMVMLSDDPEAKAVTARVPLLSRETAIMQPGAGCVLAKWED
jgi:hypothetical protein